MILVQKCICIFFCSPSFLLPGVLSLDLQHPLRGDVLTWSRRPELWVACLVATLSPGLFNHLSSFAMCLNDDWGAILEQRFPQ